MSSTTSVKSCQTKMRQHEPVVQLRAPAHEIAVVRRSPEARDEREQEQLLREAHPRVRRHLERAELDETEPAGRRRRASRACRCRSRRDACCRSRRSADCGTADRRATAAAATTSVDLRERELELVERVVARLVDARRLARRADEHAREQIRQRRMMLPIRDQAAQQVGPAQERAVRRASRRRARRDCRRPCRCGGRRA